MGWSSLRNLRQKPVEQLNERWQELFGRILKTAKLSSLGGIYSSKFVRVPLTFGVLKPIILIPSALLLQMNPKQLEAILMHELAHVKRRDFLWNFLQVMTENIFFFHPICWWITKEIRRQRELAADEWAIAQGVAPQELAFGLATVASFQLNHAVPEFAMAASKPKHPTLERIKKLLGVQSSPSQPTTLTTLTMITTIIISVFLLGMNQPVNSIPADLEETVVEEQLIAQLQEVEVRDTIPPIQKVIPRSPSEPLPVPAVEVAKSKASDKPITAVAVQRRGFNTYSVSSFESVSAVPFVDLSGLSGLSGFASLPQTSFEPIPDLNLKPITIQPLKPISIPSFNGGITFPSTASDTTKNIRKVQSIVFHNLSDTLLLDSKNLRAKIVKADSLVVFPFYKLDSLSKRQTFLFENFQQDSLFFGNKGRSIRFTMDSLGMKNLFSDSVRGNPNGPTFYFKNTDKNLFEVEDLVKSLQESTQKQREFSEIRTKELREMLKLNQQKLKDWQEANTPALEELQKQLQNWQKENEQQMKEWQQQMKLLQKELQQLLKNQQQSGKK